MPKTKSRVERAVERVVMAFEAPVKEALFDCRSCGSCLLSQTRFICPMTCPKGLRNGPCGGTLDGMCEVYPARPCVWLRIRKDQPQADPPLSLRPPFDPELFGTASWMNVLTGADAATRLPLSLAARSGSPPMEPRSRLEARLRSGQPVLTIELQSPRTTAGLRRLSRQLEILLPLADAFNTTSGAGGHEAVSSTLAAREVTRAGGDAVVQICGRDVTPAAFVDELAAAAEAGALNLLCLTGDWPALAPRIFPTSEAAQERFFPMDSSQMIYEARHLAEQHHSAFTSRVPARPPVFFIGAAANPFSDPMETAAARAWQKEACGADFLQTQVVFDADRFCRWRDLLNERPGGRRLYLLPSIPVIGRPGALDLLAHIPGIVIPPELRKRLQVAEHFERAALDLARSLMEQLAARKAVHGFHLIPFGATARQVAEIARFGRELSPRDPADFSS